ncbi:hypothetical protein D3C86_1757340 [compost metagenome]
MVKKAIGNAVIIGIRPNCPEPPAGSKRRITGFKSCGPVSTDSQFPSRITGQSMTEVIAFNKIKTHRSWVEVINRLVAAVYGLDPAFVLCIIGGPVKQLVVIFQRFIRSGQRFVISPHSKVNACPECVGGP